MTTSQLKIMALVGILIMAVGIFLPLETESSDFEDRVLFSFDRFDGPNAVRTIRNGLSSNAQGICLLGLALVAAYTARDFDGLGQMSIITLVYISLTLYILVGNEVSLSYGWVFLYGGWGLMATASYRHNQLPKHFISELPPAEPLAGLGRFEPPPE